MLIPLSGHGSRYFKLNFLTISGSAYGRMNLIPSIWDAMDDPISGIVIDRMRTRWGGIRPFLIVPVPAYDNYNACQKSADNWI